MPELPDVTTFSRRAARCVGRAVARVDVPDPGILKGIAPRTLQRRLKGSRITAARRYGKHLFLELSEVGVLEMHFGTNGSLHVLPAPEANPPYVRFSLVLDDGERIAYVNPRRIGDVQLVKDVASFAAAAKLGPDALDRHFDAHALAERVAGRKRDIKSMLMDQRLLAGIGNIYSDEILFQAGIHPDTRGDALRHDDILRLFEKMKQVLGTAIACEAGSEAGTARLPDHFLIHERHRGGHCPHCGATLVQTRRAGRTGYHCPHCQPR